MRHLSFITILALFSSAELIAQSYSGAISFGKSTINYQVKLIERDNQTKAFFTSTNMNAYEIPCQNVTFKKDTLKFYVISDYYTYAYQYLKQNENLIGNVRIYSNESEQLLNTLATSLIRNDIDRNDEIEKTDFTFESNGLQLSGTLWKPRESLQRGLFFVSSSQGNDRSGTNAEAYYFASLGYTVFNYDKRGTGKSEGDWQSATMEELCADDINALEFFSNISALPLSEIGIKGSSQGGIKIPYLLAKVPDLGFGISISSPDGTLLESDLNHWKNLNMTQIGRKNSKRALRMQEAGYNYLAGNIPYESLAQLINENRGEDWLKYVWIPEQNVPKDDKLNFSGLPYFKEITQPVLVIHGLSDEVIPAKSHKTIKRAIRKSKSTKYLCVTLENTSHSMTWLNKDFPYFQILSPKYLPLISDWLSEIQNK